MSQVKAGQFSICTWSDRLPCVCSSVSLFPSKFFHRNSPRGTSTTHGNDSSWFGRSGQPFRVRSLSLLPFSLSGQLLGNSLSRPFFVHRSSVDPKMPEDISFPASSSLFVDPKILHHAVSTSLSLQISDSHHSPAVGARTPVNDRISQSKLHSAGDLSVYGLLSLSISVASSRSVQIQSQRFPVSFGVSDHRRTSPLLCGPFLSLPGIFLNNGN